MSNALDPSWIAELRAENARLTDENAALREIRQRGCDCADDDACAFAVARDEAWLTAWDAEWRAQVLTAALDNEAKIKSDIYNEASRTRLRLKDLEAQHSALLGVVEQDVAAVKARAETAEAALAEAVELVRDLLPYLERHSYSWDGVNGRHPQVVGDAARAFLAAHGSASPQQSAECTHVAGECDGHGDF